MPDLEFKQKPVHADLIYQRNAALIGRMCIWNLFLV